MNIKNSFLSIHGTTLIIPQKAKYVQAQLNNEVLQDYTLTITSVSLEK